MMDCPSQTSASQSGNSKSWSAPSLSDAQAVIQGAFGRRLCRWQYLLTDAVSKGKHAILDVGTGMGKTLAFFTLAYLAAKAQRKITIVVTPLNMLGKQNQDQLAAAGIPAIAISAATATELNFRV